MSEVFISYAHEDQAFVRRLVAGLEGAGLSVWWDHTIPPGKTWDDVIARGIQDAKACIIIWSPHSVSSDWVKEEATLAKDGGKYLPVQIGADPPMGFRRIQAANLANWNGDADDAQWRMLVREAITLARGAAPPAAAPAPPHPAPTHPAPAPVADLTPDPAPKSKAGLVVSLAVAALVIIGGGLWLSNQHSQSNNLNVAQKEEIEHLRVERDAALANRDASAPRQEAAQAPPEQRAAVQRQAEPTPPAAAGDWVIRPSVVYAGAIARRNAQGAMSERPYDVTFDPGLNSATVIVRDSGTVRVTLALRGSWNGDTFTGTTSRISGAEWTTDAVTIVKQPGGVLKWTHADGTVTGTGTLRPR